MKSLNIYYEKDDLFYINFYINMRHWTTPYIAIDVLKLSMKRYMITLAVSFLIIEINISMTITQQRLF
jgi:hypothetical protein